jgi:hypothetical protein
MEADVKLNKNGIAPLSAVIQESDFHPMMRCLFQASVATSVFRISPLLSRMGTARCGYLLLRLLATLTALFTWVNGRAIAQLSLWLLTDQKFFRDAQKVVHNHHLLSGRTAIPILF